MVEGTGRLAGKRAVVMGVGESIEQACALRFATEGAAVAVVDPVAAIAQEVATRIIAAGGQARPYSCDMAEPAAVGDVAVDLDAAWGTLDVLVNSTGTVVWHSFADSAIADWEEVIRQGLLGPVVCSKAFLPLLERDGGGSIVHLGSVDGLFGNTVSPSYSTAKGGLVPLTHCMAHELGPRGVRVNMIARAGNAPLPPSPTGARTDFEATRPQGFEAYMQQLVRETPLGRLGAGSEFASVALFFASDDASYTTGAVLVVDGGRTTITNGTAPQGSLG